MVIEDSMAGSSRQRSPKLHILRALSLVGVAILVLGGLLALWPHTVRGTVTDANGPVAGAVVRIRATDNWTTSDAAGNFELHVQGYALHQTVTAWKDGYYIAAADLTGIGREVTLTLKPYTAQDHPGMAWLPSDANHNVELACGNCHVNLHAQWRQDAHSQAARNPLVLSLYNGTDVAGRPAGPGFRLDFPGEVGNCASCHAPGAAVDHPNGVDLNQVSGEAANGVFCQFCHSIHDARRPYAETTTGVNAIDLRRPPPGEHLFIGPYDDVPMRDTFRPIQQQSQVCASCHSGSWWGVPAYESFDEWKAGPYAAQGVQCQSCHMAPDQKMDRVASACAPGQPLPVIGETLCQVQACLTCHLGLASPDSLDPTKANALVPSRDPNSIFTHRSPGSRDEALLRRAVTMAVTATQGADGVLVDVAITNSGAGHHVPTDSPLRNMILLVTARDAQGRPLAYLGREVVPSWGGEKSPISTLRVQSPISNYAGQPGKGFAKVMEDWEGESPAPPWRNGIRVLSDNRIPAKATDISHYPFALPPDSGAVTVEAKLIYRRAFKAWADLKGWDLPDFVMAQVTTSASRSDVPLVRTLPQNYNMQLFAPSLATTASGQRLSSSAFATSELCSQCHASSAASWQASSHARATTSPLYRAWYKVADQNLQGQMGSFCAGCHTPIGLLSGQVRSRWTWWGQEAHPLDALAQSGVSCDTCHSVVGATGLANAAYVMDPQMTTQTSALSITDHRARYARDLLTKAEFCATCHEATNPTSNLPVMTTYSEWRKSRYNTGDRATATTCQGCHFAAGRHGELRLADLTGAARVELLPLNEAVAGNEVALQVRVTNVGAGHDLPTGAAELRQMWLAVTVSDASGRRIFSSGETNEYGDPVQGAVTYGVTWRDAEGKPTDRLWEAVSVLRDHRIPAGSSTVEVYRFTLPPKTPGPLRVRAALKYRAAAGYLTSLMSIYLKSEVPSAPTVEMAVAEGSVPVRIQEQ